MKNERGAILLLVLLGLFTVTILASAFVHLGMYEQRHSEYSQSGSQAFYLAESALDRGLNWLRGQLVPPDAARQPFGQTSVALGTGSYLTTITPDPNNPFSQIKRFTIQGEGRTGTWATPMATRVNSLIVQTESFAQYAYFTNSERSWPNGVQVYFITGDRLTGPTHTNGEFSMFGRPIFEGPVSSVSSRINLWGGAAVTQPVFKEAPKLGVPEKKFPTSYPSGIVEAAGNGGLSVRGSATVTLLPDGKVRISNSFGDYNNTVLPLPRNGVLYVSGNVELKGTLKGQLTIGSAGDVRIVDSVKYATDPRTNPKSTDLLGIVAGQNIQVAKEAPNDLKIDGSIMALNRSFGVENWWERPPRGTLSVYGGIIQANRGPVGSFNGNNGTKLSGYTKDYRYDPRLKSMSPPAFPTTGDYTVLLWQEQ
ncbi:MAG: DUF4900 domain-containing protein [Candidatus Omnitrophica bacterium]|nr:DUF4900 domain-containing protein [Candidatus Omnitrophota bacterium]